MRPRIFVSSVMEGFKEYREAARNGILDAGGEPVLVEDYPALSVSPRTACLDGVSSCDLFMIIIGARGGWTAPSGKLVIEEEYEEARRCKLRIFAFVQNTDRDEAATRLVEKISDFVNGVFRPTFVSAKELQSAVREALGPIIDHYSNQEVDLHIINKKFDNPYEIYNETSLRFAFGPERVEEMIDPVYLESEELRYKLFEIGHSPQVGFFSYERPKKFDVKINEIVILQSEEGGRRGDVDEVRFELSTNGMIVIDINVTGSVAEGREDHFESYSVLLEDDIVHVLRKSFAFTHAFYEWKDPFKRYDRMMYNSALSGLGHRTLMREPPKGGGYQMGQHGDEVIMAFDQPRLLTRQELENPEKEIEATLSLFRRRLKT